MSNNIKKLNKLEQKFLFEELVPIQFEELKETEEKKRLKFFLEAHKVENITPFEKVLKTKNTSKEKYFSKAKYITFSTTFSKYEWFEKLTKFSSDKKIIGYCHNSENWKYAIDINPNVEIINKI